MSYIVWILYVGGCVYGYRVRAKAAFAPAHEVLCVAKLSPAFEAEFRLKVSLPYEV
jgi:hypothetical protein